MRGEWRLQLEAGAWKITSYYSKNLKTTWSQSRFLDAMMIDQDALSQSYYPPTHRLTLISFRAVSAREAGPLAQYSRWIRTSSKERKSSSSCWIGERWSAKKPMISPRVKGSEHRRLPKECKLSLMKDWRIMKNLPTSHRVCTNRCLNLMRLRERKSSRKVASRLTWHFLTNAAYSSQWRNTSSTLTLQITWTSWRMLRIRHKCSRLYTWQETTVRSSFSIKITDSLTSSTLALIKKLCY